MPISKMKKLRHREALTKPTMVRKWWSQDFIPEGSDYRVPWPEELREKGAGLSDTAHDCRVGLAVFMFQIDLLGVEL